MWNSKKLNATVFLIRSRTSFLTGTLQTPDTPSARSSDWLKPRFRYRFPVERNGHQHIVVLARNVSRKALLHQKHQVFGKNLLLFVLEQVDGFTHSWLIESGCPEFSV